MQRSLNCVPWNLIKDSAWRLSPDISTTQHQGYANCFTMVDAKEMKIISRLSRIVRTRVQVYMIGHINCRLLKTDQQPIYSYIIQQLS